MFALVEEFQAILYSLIGGARYGIKVRLPHAVIMTSLFRNDLSSSQKINNILQLVMEHATNLAAFAALYKSIVLILKVLSHKYAHYTTATGQKLSCIRDVGFFRYYGRILVSILRTLTFYLFFLEILKVFMIF
jgi:hypothetical protein